MSIPSPAECLKSTATPWGSTRWRTIRRCMREHYLKNSVGLRLRVIPADPEVYDLDEIAPEESAKPNPLDAGSIVHAAFRWNAEHCMRELEAPDHTAIIAAAEALNAAAPGSLDPRAIDEADRLLSHYWNHYNTANCGWPESAKIIACEIPLSYTPIEDAGFKLAEFAVLPEEEQTAKMRKLMTASRENVLGALPVTGQADLVLQLASGEIIVPDHKTRAKALPRYRDEFAISSLTNSQFCALSWLVKQHFTLDYYPSVWLNAIIKTKVPKFDRLVIPFNSDRGTAAVERWARWQKLNSAIAIESAMPNIDACVNPFDRRCNYFAFCHGTLAERERHFEIEKPEMLERIEQ